MNVVELTEKLIACASVTPEDDGAQVMLSTFLEEMGFVCHSLPFGGTNGEYEVPNFFARLGNRGKHLCYAGHTDVVPPGSAESWTYGPFTPTIKDGVLYGRGASDMKGSVAAFACAVAEFIKKHGVPDGSVSMLITGDEESVAINGTVKVLEWMKTENHLPDVSLVGEPTNPDHLGQEIKVGRRGSLDGFLEVHGTQGHVAYQHLADNPMPRLIKLLDILSSHVFDEGTEFFAPTNLEITTIDVGNKATNVIPKSGQASFNIRFNDIWSSDSLKAQIKSLLDTTGFNYDLRFEGNAESFITQPGEWTEIVASAVEDVSGKRPAYTTTGGTSDARFVVNYSPVIECGSINESIHQIDENTRVSDLEDLMHIYLRVLERYFEV